MTANMKILMLVLIISLLVFPNNYSYSFDFTYSFDLDGEIRRITLENRTDFMDDAMDFFSNLGNTEMVIPLLIVIPDKEAKIDTFKSLLVSATVTQALKISIGQKRPPGPKEYRHFTNDGDYHAMPSGHASGSLAIATTLSKHYPEYKIPFYTTATLIAYSRVYKDRHWFSNVVAGAAIGYLSANFVELKW